jgi:TRAP-type C4-dicarboxylate transport system permease small subunit
MARLETLVLMADRALRWVLDAFVVAMAGALLVLLNYAVFSRFVLNASVSWGEELPAHMLAALTFIGAAYLTRTNEHLGFDGGLLALPPLLRRVVAGAGLILMAGFGLALAWYGGRAAFSFSGRMLISLDLPVILFRGAMPLGGALIALICSVRLIALIMGRIAPEDLLPEGDG